MNTTPRESPSNAVRTAFRRIFRRASSPVSDAGSRPASGPRPRRSLPDLSVRACGAALAAIYLAGCAVVKQKDREYLSDPVMQRIPDPMGAGLESHNLPRREGSAGGNAGSGGGCGC